jgi:hypothetical protein
MKLTANPVRRAAARSLGGEGLEGSVGTLHGAVAAPGDEPEVVLGPRLEPVDRSRHVGRVRAGAVHGRCLDPLIGRRPVVEAVRRRLATRGQPAAERRRRRGDVGCAARFHNDTGGIRRIASRGVCALRGLGEEVGRDPAQHHESLLGEEANDRRDGDEAVRVHVGRRGLAREQPAAQHHVEIAHDLHDRGIPSPTGKPVWGTSTLQRLLRNEAYVGRVYYNRRETINGAPARRGARRTKTRYRDRPRDEWILIPAPAIIDQDSFERAQQVRRENPKWNPRGAEPGHWLLRGLIECGHCQVGCNCHKMRGRNGTFHRYYYCRNHDILRAGGEHLRCPERNIRADELDAYVFAQVRRALLEPAQLIAGEHAVISTTPANDDELIGAQLAALERKLEQTDVERVRLLDAYQAALLDLAELTRRTAALSARRDQLAAEHAELTSRRADLARENRLRRGIAGFAERVLASLDELDFDGRQRLLRLVVEKVRVTGWHVEIRLKIPLADDPPPQREPRAPNPGAGPSSDMGLRSVGDLEGRQLPPPRPRPRRPPTRPRARNRLTNQSRRPPAGPQNASQHADPSRRGPKSAPTVPDQPPRVLTRHARQTARAALTAAPATGLRPVAAHQRGSTFNRRRGGPFSTGLDKK